MRRLILAACWAQALLAQVSLATIEPDRIYDAAAQQSIPIESAAHLDMTLTASIDSTSAFPTTILSQIDTVDKFTTATPITALPADKREEEEGKPIALPRDDADHGGHLAQSNSHVSSIQPSVTSSSACSTKFTTTYKSVFCSVTTAESEWLVFRVPSVLLSALRFINTSLVTRYRCGVCQRLKA